LLTPAIKAGASTRLSHRRYHQEQLLGKSLLSLLHRPKKCAILQQRSGVEVRSSLKKGNSNWQMAISQSQNL